MTRTLTILALCAFLLGCKSTRNTPCETVGAVGDKLAQDNDQSNRNDDRTIQAAIADSDGDSTNESHAANVESQENYNAMAPQLKIDDLFGGAKMAASILAHTSHGEAAVLRQLERVEEMQRARSDQVNAGIAPVTDEAALDALHASLVAKLDGYAQAKWDRAAAVKGVDLSSLESIIITLTSEQHVGTGDPGAMKDAQKASMMDVAERALAPEGGAK